MTIQRSLFARTLPTVLLVFFASDLVGQEDGLTEGTRIRVFTAGGGIHVGAVTSITHDSIALKTTEKPPPTIEDFALTAIERLDVSDGFERTGNWKKGAAIGAGVGLLIGGSLALLAPGDDSPVAEETGRRIAITVLATAVGAGAGALIGTGPRKERWREIPLKSLGVGFSNEGYSIALSVSLGPGNN